MPDESSSTLQGCLDRLQAGDPQARGQVIQYACRRLRRLTQAMLRDFPRLRAYEDAEDVLQNAVLRLLRALQVVVPPTSADFFRLAAQLIRRELIDLSRHYFGRYGPGKCQVALDGQGSPHRPPVAGPVPSDSTYHPVKLARWTEFHEHAEALPAEEKAVFDLVWYQGLSQVEAASLLNLSHTTIKRRWVAARLRLQAALQGDELRW